MRDLRRQGGGEVRAEGEGGAVNQRGGVEPLNVTHPVNLGCWMCDMMNDE